MNVMMNSMEQVDVYVDFNDDDLICKWVNFL